MLRRLLLVGLALLVPATLAAAIINARADVANSTEEPPEPLLVAMFHRHHLMAMDALSLKTEDQRQDPR
jgi:hypothetical protein